MRPRSDRLHARGRPAPAARAALRTTAAALAFAAAGASAAPLDEVVRRAITDYPSIRAAQANRNVAEARIDEARARHLPTVDIGAAGRVSGSAVSTPLPRARVNLYAGGAIESAVDRETLRASASESRETEARDEVAFGATQAYLRTLRAAWLVRATQANLARHQRLAEDFEQIVRIDVGRRFDLVQAQARVQGVRGTLEDRLAELGSARQALARFYPEPIEPSELALPAVADIPLEPARPIGDQEHPSVVSARRDVSAAEANARTVRLLRRPRLDLEATGGRDPLSQVVLSWPAFDATLTAAEQGAVAERIGAEATLQDVELAIAEARRQADQDFVSAGRRLEQARVQVQLATELVTIYYEQFRVGRRPLLDLLAAYAELATGEANLAGAQVDQALARYRVAYTTSEFAPRFQGTFAGLAPVPMPRPAVVPPMDRIDGAPAPVPRTPLPVPAVPEPGAPGPGTRAPGAPGPRR